MTTKSTEIVRDEYGRFPKGHSGNPAGRPKNTKNHITELKQNLEVAVRENVTAQDVQEIIGKLVEMAKAGDKGAAKIILDKTISGANNLESEHDHGSGIRVIIENATFGNSGPDERVIN